MLSFFPTQRHACSHQIITQGNAEDQGGIVRQHGEERMVYLLATGVQLPQDHGEVPVKVRLRRCALWAAEHATFYVYERFIFYFYSSKKDYLTALVPARFLWCFP